MVKCILRGVAKLLGALAVLFLLFLVEERVRGRIELEVYKIRAALTALAKKAGTSLDLPENV